MSGQIIIPPAGHAAVAKAYSTGSLVIIDPAMPDKHPLPRTGIAGVILAGVLTVAVGLGGGVSWAALAPLHSAVVAPGVLQPEGGRKTVKHNEGGVIAKDGVLVHEGETVKAGQPLINLDRTEAESQVEALGDQLLRAQAEEARLQSESDAKLSIAWPEWFLRNKANPRVQTVMGDQQGLANARWNQFLKMSEALNSKIDTSKAALAQLDEQRKQYDGVAKAGQSYANMQESLRQKQLARMPDYWNAQRQGHLDVAKLSEVNSAKAEKTQDIVNAQAELIKLKTTRNEEVADGLNKARGVVQDTLAKLRDWKNKVANRSIVAPDSGVVTGLQHLAAGASITPNQAIMDIVPADEMLLAETKVQPKDIKELHPGLETKVVLSAYDSRVVGTLDGIVDYISADLLTDTSNPNQPPYYLVKIRIRDASKTDVHGLHITPGMPVEARIQISERTALDYIVSPLKQSYLKAFIQ